MGKRLRVLVLGGRGFLGSAVCEQLRKHHEVITFDRHSGKKNHITGNVLHLPDVVHAAKGADMVVNLVGLSPMKRPQRETYHQVHVQAVRYIIEACRRNNVKRLVHISALGADKKSPVEYLKTKALGEEIILASKIPATIFCPSVIFDERSELVMLAKKIRWFMVFPNIQAKVQPIYRQDVAKLCALVVDGKINEQRLEVGGPQVMTLFQMVKKVFNKKRFPCIPLPFWMWDWELEILSRLGWFGLSKDQIMLTSRDNVVKSNKLLQYFRPVSFDRWLKKAKL